MNTELTQEQVNDRYFAALDSVNLINSLQAKAELTPDDVLRIETNQEHLKIMLTKTFWNNQNLDPLRTASVSITPTQSRG